MIRIDEIYENIFLPAIKQKLSSSLHWFDPFGSVEFNDLRSLPHINHGTRYLCWDQEPLHKNMVDNTLTKFDKIFSANVKYLITSERESDFVEYACLTYNFLPLYYFFHGWAALDWYRGYDKTYLISNPKERTITKTFIMPNRIVAGQRQHRLIMLYYIFKNNLINNWISCPNICPAENLSVLDAAVQLTEEYPDIVEVFKKQQLPIDFPNELGHPMKSCWLDLFDESAECLLYLVTETVATGRRLHLTEKTFKPICMRMPFIIVGTQGSLAYLRSYGFKTFDCMWDESYDNEVDDTKRLAQIASLLRSLDELSVERKQELFNQCQEIIQHNYNHFYKGGFEEILWQEFINMMESINV